MKNKCLIAGFAGVAVLFAVGVAMKLTEPTDFFDTMSIDSTLTSFEAVSDLDYVYRIVSENHPCFYDGSDLPVKLEQEYNLLRQKLLQSETVTVSDLWRAAAQMCHTLDDAHTIISSIGDRFVNDISEINGNKIISVDGVPVENLLDDFKTVFPFEPQVEFYADYMFYSEAVLSENQLGLLGIDTSDGVDMVIKTDNATIERHYDFVEISDVTGVSTETKLCDYTIDKENSIGIFTLNECVLNDEYLNMLDSFFTEVIYSGISSVAVDLRENGGGNSYVINEFLKYTDTDEYYIFGEVEVRNGDMLETYTKTVIKNEKKPQVFSGDIYVLTSNYTFSSAMDFAVTVSDNKLGTVIGERPGNMPTAYGDKLTFQCPVSGLLCSVSYKKFHRIDTEKDGLPLIPDISIEAEKAVDKLYEIAVKK